MTPKEKAKKLMLRYYVYDLDNDEQWYVANKFAKHCALIAVDEIINSSPSLPIEGSGGYFGEDIELSTKWWQEVKQELQML